MPESTPLLSSRGGSSSDYYFLKNAIGDGSSAQDAGATVEPAPDGADANEFAPKLLGPRRTVVAPSNQQDGGFFSKFFPKKNTMPKKSTSMVKQRKAPIKVEPKVFFANERTFLAWMHVSILLAGASIAILAFSGSSENPVSQIYGVVMLPVAIAFIVYSMYQYIRRAYMIRNRHPGPYDDTVGPTVLGIMLMLSIVAQFGIKLYTMSL